MHTIRKHVPTAARLFLGLVFTVFGLNFFLHFLPMPPAPPRAAAFAGALFASGYLFPLLKATEVVAGLLLLGGLFVPLALARAGAHHHQHRGLPPVPRAVRAADPARGPGRGARTSPGATARRSRRCCTRVRRCRSSRKRASRRASCTRLPDARHFLRVRSKTFWSFGLPPSKDVQVSRM